ncbi:ribosomal protein RPL7A [Cardiosporidium cionae]|uniref:60S ribosomal protein L7a n=1 Tax=Cardiosporidium cionae TaxID=476202 RepID=A0ABQ7J9T5_9APIC|nr:ribosomal protein RPL7A [Cardiosporidium cionae]|eukprot:KAF8820768.1 ribosomal protein RPL7A [Cardiosporidium cionae]
MAPTKKSKKLPPVPVTKKTTIVKKQIEKYVERTPRSFRVGGAIQHSRDVTRFVRWPKYIRLQRQRRILLQRLKVPPALNQFNQTLDKNQASQLVRLLDRYKPETQVEKKVRLIQDAKKQGEQKLSSGKRPIMIKYGLNHVTDLVELKKAKLVVIAHDVDPVELVVWLPTLCRKKDVPYCIIKGKSRLGKLVHKKNTCVLAIDNIRKEDAKEFEIMCKNFRAKFNDNIEVRRKWGGGIMGIKAQHVQHRQEKENSVEIAKKMGLTSS